MPMTRRSFVQLGAAAALPVRARAARNDRPNILFLLTDQQRFDCVGAYGNRAIRTPNMDRIGREGVIFSSANLHAGAQRTAHRTFTMASRDARHDEHGSTVSAGEATGAARRRLLHR